MDINELPKEIMEKITKFNQAHLLEALKNCKTPEEKQNLISQIKTINFELMHNLYEQGKTLLLIEQNKSLKLHRLL